VLCWILRDFQETGRWGWLGTAQPCAPSLVSSGSDSSVDLHVRQSTAWEKKPLSVAVSALAVVRQCKIKLIKPPTQENITGN